MNRCVGRFIPLFCFQDSPDFQKSISRYNRSYHAEATAEEIMAHLARQVAPHKKIREVEFVEQIPKSPTGKMLRRVLVLQEREELASQQTELVR